MDMNVKEEFWGCVLSKDSKTYVWSPESPEEFSLDIVHKLAVTQACLGLTAKENERNVIDVITQDDDGEKMTFTILSMKIGGIEQCKLELGFQNKTVFKLVQGSGPVHICGSQLEGLPEGLSDEDEESEEEYDSTVQKKAEKLPVKRAMEEAVKDAPPAKKAAPKVEVKEKAVVPEEKPAAAAPAAKKPVAAAPKVAIKESEESDEDDDDEEDEEDDEDESEEESEEEEEEEAAPPPAKKQAAVAAPKKEGPKEVAKNEVKKVDPKALLDDEAEEESGIEGDSGDEEMESDDDDDDEEEDEDMESDEDEEDDDEDDDDDDDEEDEDEESEEEEVKPKKGKAMVNGHGKDAKPKEVATPQKKEKADTNTPNKTPKNKAGMKTPEPKLNMDQIKVKLAKSPNLPKTIEKFKNFMRSAHKLQDEETVTNLWDWLQKNKASK